MSESDFGVAKADQVRERKIAALSQDYPAWRIRYVRLLGPRWWATRYAVLTDAQRAAGLVPSIAREDVVSLAMELAVQDEIAHQSGYSTGEPAPGTQPAADLPPRAGGPPPPTGPGRHSIRWAGHQMSGRGAAHLNPSEEEPPGRAETRRDRE